MMGTTAPDNLWHALDTRTPCADAIASRNPCRIIALCPVAGDDEGVKAQSFLLVPIKSTRQLRSSAVGKVPSTGTVAALERVAE